MIKVNAFNKNEAKLEVFLESSMCSAINMSSEIKRVSTREPTDNWIKRDILTLNRSGKKTPPPVQCWYPGLLWLLLRRSITLGTVWVQILTLPFTAYVTCCALVLLALQ